MAFLGVRDALLARLTGAPASLVGVRLREAAGLAQGQRQERASGPAELEGRGGVLLYPEAPYDALRRVPVLPYDIVGTDYATLPVVTVFSSRPPTPRRDASYGFKDTIQEDVDASAGEVTFVDGTTVEGPSLLKLRPIPRPYNYEFVIRLWGASEAEVMLLSERVLELLDERGYLSVTLRDGSVVTYDTQFDQFPAAIDVPPGLFDEGDAGEYSARYTYVVEGYLDTTDQKTLEPTIRSRSHSFGEYGADADQLSRHEPDSTQDKP